MVSIAIDSISPANIKQAFECCAIGATVTAIAEDRLNQRLQEVLSWRGGRGIAPLDGMKTSADRNDVEHFENDVIVRIDTVDEESRIGFDDEYVIY